MVNRQRMMLDLDSEGFPIQQPYGIAAWMIGKQHDGQVQVGLLADARCVGCGPDYASTEARILDHMASNPEGWREVDGVQLPSVASWAELDHDLAQMHVQPPINCPIVCEDCCPDGECAAERALQAGRAT